ncbi:protein CHROMATIN REMODELING 5-like isoform X5 [Iris pallida]|uniref:Protein CHROMATIN REMODELING 5-like isoform X5 n=1 Tax=Iris pallida TaxID=29817 RepID=A0AAX6GN87_IRIPA|nr:protein CHROMATIN REMODELING 5-like isoform X5 [Iris pallida]
MSSGKLVILDKLLIKLRETKHRVLIFSQELYILKWMVAFLTRKPIRRG